jgi:hypothetical protein
VAEGGGNGGWERPAKLWADKAAAAVRKWLAQQRCCSDRVVDERAHTVLYFPELSKPIQTCKLKIDALSCSKNFQFLHAARLGHY